MQQWQVKLRLAAGLWLAAALLCGCGQSDVLDAGQFAREVHALASLSAEAAFLCGERGAGHLTANATAVHLRDLAEDAARSRQALAAPAPPALRRQQAAAQHLAAELARSLHLLALAQAGPAEQVERERLALARLKAQFDALGQRT